MDPDASEDHGWLKKHGVTRQELKLQRQHEFPYQPMISIVVPLYNTPLKFLKAMVESIQKQSYPNWELCLADGSTDDQAGEMIRKNYGKDVRIRYRRLPVNKGISERNKAGVLHRSARGQGKLVQLLGNCVTIFIFLLTGILCLGQDRLSWEENCPSRHSPLN